MNTGLSSVLGVAAMSDSGDARHLKTSKLQSISRDQISLDRKTNTALARIPLPKRKAEGGLDTGLPWKKSNRALRHLRDLEPVTTNSKGETYATKWSRDGTSQTGRLASSPTHKLRVRTDSQGPRGGPLLPPSVASTTFQGPEFEPSEWMGNEASLWYEYDRANPDLWTKFSPPSEVQSERQGELTPDPSGLQAGLRTLQSQYNSLPAASKDTEQSKEDSDDGVPPFPDTFRTLVPDAAESSDEDRQQRLMREHPPRKNVGVPLSAREWLRERSKVNYAKASKKLSDAYEDWVDTPKSPLSPIGPAKQGVHIDIDLEFTGEGRTVSLDTMHPTGSSSLSFQEIREWPDPSAAMFKRQKGKERWQSRNGGMQNSPDEKARLFMKRTISEDHTNGLEADRLRKLRVITSRSGGLLTGRYPS